MAVVITVCLKMRDNYAVMRYSIEYSSEAISAMGFGVFSTLVPYWIGWMSGLQLSSSQVWLEVRYRQPTDGRGNEMGCFWVNHHWDNPCGRHFKQRSWYLVWLTPPKTFMRFGIMLFTCAQSRQNLESLGVLVLTPG